MPKPHSEVDIQQAVFDLYGLKFGYLESYSRMYVRKDGKFIPVGYEITLLNNKFNEVTRRFTPERTIRYLTDDDLGF